jgi:hypothetical protein
VRWWLTCTLDPMTGCWYRRGEQFGGEVGFQSGESAFETQRCMRCARCRKPNRRCALAPGLVRASGRSELMSVDSFGTERTSLWCAAILHQCVFTGLIVLGLLASGCSRNKSLAQAPATTLPSVGYEGPAPEIENQSTSAPIVVETLPEPTAIAAEAQPNLAPPAQLTLPPKPPKSVVESRRAARTNVPAAVEAPPVVQAPPIQLLPQFSESDKQALSRKISEQLDSAQSLVDSLNESHLTEQQKPNVAAVLDFMKKSRDAVKRGEFYQGLVLAQKANTLAASLVTTP